MLMGVLLSGGLLAAPGLADDTGPLSPQTQTPMAECDDGAASEKRRSRCHGGPNTVDELTVEAAPNGKTEGPIEAEIVLDEAALQSFGARNVMELLAAIDPLVKSGRSRNDEPPVFLVNGQRTAGILEIRNIPIEAFKGLSIFPEEKALSYGYRADQRVINFELKKYFKSLDAQADTRRPTAGGRASSGQQATYFRTDKSGRASATLRYNRDSALYEDERDIVRTSPSAPYDLQGNLAGTAIGHEIDPALSALAGVTISSALVPRAAANGRPALADFVPGAGQVASDDLTASRTLMPRTEAGGVEGSYTRSVRTVTSTVSASLERSNSRSLQGLPGFALSIPAANPYSPFSQDVILYRSLPLGGALQRRSDTDKVELGLNMLGNLGRWRWTLTGNFDQTESTTKTGRGIDVSALRAAVAGGDPGLNPFGPIPSSLIRLAPQDTAQVKSTNGRADITFAGTLAELPSGAVQANIRVGADRRKVESRSVRSGIGIDRALTRDRAVVQTNLNVPLLRRSDEGLGRLGSVMLNGNFIYEQFSDLGGLITAGGSIFWSPTAKLSLAANYTYDDGEPSPQFLNNPIQQTPNVPVYDFATGQTVAVSLIEGGNPKLSTQSRQLVRFSINFKPFEKRDLRLSATFTDSHLDDPIASFPSVSPELEAAFPERFVRDASGRLVSIDTRPLNFAREVAQDIRVGLTYSRRWLGPSPTANRPPGAAQPVAARPAPARPQGGPPPGTSAMLGEIPPGATVLQMALNWTWRLKNEVVVREGMAPLDLLDGASLGRRGGTPAHELTFSANLARHGYGAVFRGAWKASTWVDGGVRGDDLRFSDLPTFGASLYVEPAKNPVWKQRAPWLASSRVSLTIENILDTHQRVRDEKGVTPQAYQPDFLDPLGRTVRLSVRKLF